MTEPTSNPNDSRINLDKTEQPSHPSEPQPDPHPQSYQGPAVGQPPAPVPYAAPYPGQYPYPAEYQAADAHTIAMLAHLSLLLWGFTPLILWAVYKDKPGYGFTKRAATRGFNMMLTWGIVSAVLFILYIVLIGIGAAGAAGARSGGGAGAAGIMVLLAMLVLAVLGIGGLIMLIFNIMGAVKSNNGEDYNYPVPYFKLIKE